MQNHNDNSQRKITIRVNPDRTLRHKNPKPSISSLLSLSRNPKSVNLELLKNFKSETICLP